jgi:hypothetical protein
VIEGDFGQKVPGCWPPHLALRAVHGLLHARHLTFVLRTDYSVPDSERLVLLTDCSVLNTSRSVPDADCSAFNTLRSHRAPIAQCPTLDALRFVRIAPRSALCALRCSRIAPRSALSAFVVRSDRSLLCTWRSPHERITPLPTLDAPCLTRIAPRSALCAPVLCAVFFVLNSRRSMLSTDCSVLLT